MHTICIYDFNKRGSMPKKGEKITVEILLFYCTKFGVLTPREAAHCLATGQLPDDILERLKIAQLKSKN
jgi:hypothetical protein